MIPMQNNPMMALMSAMRQSRDPREFIQRMAAQNPQARMAMQMIQGKNPRQLEQMVRNMARERGVDIEELARSMGVAIPSGR